MFRETRPFDGRLECCTIPSVSNSQAFPILTTSRLDEAYDCVSCAIQIAEPGDCLVDVRAITNTRDGLQRYVIAMPSAVLEAEVPSTLAGHAREAFESHLSADRLVNWGDGGLMVIASADDQVAVEVLERLPAVIVEVKLEDVPLKAFDRSLLDALGGDRASVMWNLAGWPALPQLHLPAQRKHAGVQLTVNSVGIDELRPATSHTVYFHVGGGTEEGQRADWLAHSIGYTAVGAPEHGW